MQYIIEPVYTPLTDGEINGIVNQYDLRGETREKMIQKLRGLQGKIQFQLVMVVILNDELMQPYEDMLMK